jgi:hypothetical protein
MFSNTKDCQSLVLALKWRDRSITHERFSYYRA